MRTPPHVGVVVVKYDDASLIVDTSTSCDGWIVDGRNNRDWRQFIAICNFDDFVRLCDSLVEIFCLPLSVKVS